MQYVFVTVYVISFGFDNKVINEGEKLHFTLRLNLNPQNPSSFYASPELPLPQPSVTQSHSCLNPSSLPLCLPLTLSHTHRDTHINRNRNECSHSNICAQTQTYISLACWANSQMQVGPVSLSSFLCFRDVTTRSWPKLDAVGPSWRIRATKWPIKVVKCVM